MRTADTLYLGASIPNSEQTVTPDDFERFLREVVTLRYPGFTFWSATGAWLAQREPSYVLRIVHDGTARDRRSVESIARNYKHRFHQQSVLRETASVDAQLV